MIQTRTQQRAIIDTAKKDGTLGTLLYYMVADLGGGKTDALAVNGFLPVVKVAPDPAITEHDAHLMLELCRSHNPTMPMHIELTAVDVLEAAKVPYFEFGALDLVCPGCGAINDSCVCQPNVWRVEVS